LPSGSGRVCKPSISLNAPPKWRLSVCLLGFGRPKHRLSYMFFCTPRCKIRFQAFQKNRRHGCQDKVKRDILSRVQLIAFLHYKSDIRQQTCSRLVF
jgi:hypothetical protein